VNEGILTSGNGNERLHISGNESKGFFTGGNKWE
jgi:hypothetical protein